MKSKYKIGDRVRCIPGFDLKGLRRNNRNYGGAGYIEGREFVISEIHESNNGISVLWSNSFSNGIFEDAVTLVDQHENYEIY